ncbi:spectrin beta chain, erythrocytic [Plakobranchus ocellatus]|uniref:Spectrin beta chain, erythrocytic n=1 Tax=Plakobranchus ocellatus TaxID=259542 RepID=A0AAV3Y5L5_9GAST|nr:spectrin beta chain, erythrocytic [Plakobranchus ocellatus]
MNHSLSIKLVNISSNDVADGNVKLTLGLVWSIILHWQVKDVMKNVMEDLGQTNLERTLLNWCQLSTKGYEKVEISNFTTSWRDGLAFNALIHHYRPDLFNYKELLEKDSLYNLNHAFDVASYRLGIDKLLDAEVSQKKGHREPASRQTLVLELVPCTIQARFIMISAAPPTSA